ncbi:MAG: type II toxin-antitoxin system HicB family antitoxin, partial [Candidatus Desantisbacteria bacterium]
MDRYEIIIYWSDEDNAYISEVPELPGCMAHGESHESAVKNVRDAI